LTFINDFRDSKADLSKKRKELMTMKIRKWKLSRVRNGKKKD
jgi:hypothetical protein